MVVIAIMSFVAGAVLGCFIGLLMGAVALINERAKSEDNYDAYKEYKDRQGNS